MKKIKDIWNYATKKKRKELLKVLGYKTEWANLSWNEMGRRGGGMILDSLTRLNKLRGTKSYLKTKKPNKK